MSKNSNPTMGLMEALRWMYKFAKPYRIWLYLGVVMIISSTVINLLKVYYIKKLVDNALMKLNQNLIVIMIIVIIIFVIGLFISYLSTFSTQRFGLYIERDMKTEISIHITKLNVSNLEKTHSGDIISIMNNEVPTITNFINGSFSDIIFQIIMFLSAALYLLFINWKLFLASFIIIPFTMFIINKIGKRTSILSKENFQITGESNAIIQDALGGIDVIKSFNLENIFLKKVKDGYEKSLKVTLTLEKIRAAYLPVMFTQTRFPNIICMLYGGYLIIKGEIFPGDLVAFAQLIGYLVIPSIMLPNLTNNLRNCIGAIERLSKLMDLKTEREDGCDLQEIDTRSVIQFNNVSFNYNETETVLKRLSFEVSKGSVTALVGSSGSGKSTIIKLMCGFYEVNDGIIKLFGKDIKELNLSSIREKIAFVTQDIYLFYGTIAENIMYGKKGTSMDQVISAAKIANAHYFIEQLPGGYNTQVGEKGINLSGGQRQRISIARAILKNAPLVLLDEPTSFLDAQSETIFQEALEFFKRNHTVLVIAHRLSAIKKADNILLLEEGCIKEMGTHEYLISKEGLYKQLYKKQFINQDNYEVGACGNV